MTKLNIFGQDIHFSQLAQTQLYANPAFTGISYGPKLLSQYRIQYPRVGADVNSGYNSMMCSYDQFLPTIQSGIGAQVIADKFGSNMVSRYSLNLMYAYQVKLSRYHALRMGLQGSYHIQQVDLSQLHFFDQIDPIQGFTLPTQENLNQDVSSSFFNVNAGLLYYRTNFYAGVSARNLLANKTFFGNSSNDRFYQTLLSAQIGGVIRMGRENQFALFPIALYERQYGYQKLVTNLLAQYKMINVGIGARHNISELESIILLFGCNFNHVRFSYSYDIGTNSLAPYSGGTHEIGLRISFGGEDNSLSPNAEKELTYCPDFLKN